jgi:dTDP-4-amino-4,6-dideoxygalactose transaminase
LEENSKINSDKIRLELQKNNIESRPLWKPMHLQPVFNTYQAFTNGVSEDLFNRGLCLPSGSNMSDQDLNRVVDIIKNLYES